MRSKHRKHSSKRRRTRRRQRGGNTACIVFTLTKNAGFFSVFFFLCHSYLVAKKKNIPFFIEHDNWPFTYRNGWHDYFKTLTYYDPKSAYTRVTRFQHLKHDNSYRFTNKEYADVIREIFIPDEAINTMIKDTKASLSNQYISIMIRKGDKVRGNTKEMEELSIQDLLNQTSIKNESGNLFVMTDEYSIIPELKQILTKKNIVTLSTEKESGFYLSKFNERTPEEKLEHTRNLVASSLILVDGSPAWSDVRSNTGRFHKLLSPETVSLYPGKTDVSMETTSEPWFHL